MVTQVWSRPVYILQCRCGLGHLTANGRLLAKGAIRCWRCGGEPELKSMNDHKPRYRWVEAIAGWALVDAKGNGGIPVWL